MQISEIEYDVIMRAIDNAKNETAEDTFIDPYADPKDIERYTNEDCLEALESIENKIMREFNPF